MGFCFSCNYLRYPFCSERVHGMKEVGVLCIGLDGAKAA